MVTYEDVFRARRSSEHSLKLKDPKCPIIIALETIFSPPVKPNAPGRVLTQVSKSPDRKAIFISAKGGGSIFFGIYIFT